MTNEGQYGEGDVFLGIKVLVQRKIAMKYKHLNFKDIQELLESKIHEYRMVALLILIIKYNFDDDDHKTKIFDFYMTNSKNINNCDLVDVTAPYIVGKYLLNRDRSILYDLAISENVWEKRIAIISTFEFIRNNESKDTLAIARILINDKHDLIHKAVGWMLREVGKRVDLEKEEEFLQKHYMEMPRTMLRYAIERFPEEKRKKYLTHKSLSFA